MSIHSVLFCLPHHINTSTSIVACCITSFWHGWAVENGGKSFFDECDVKPDTAETAPNQESHCLQLLSIKEG